MTRHGQRLQHQLPRPRRATPVRHLNSDWSALIEDVVAAKLSIADSIETKITKNETKISAYQKLQSLLTDIADRRLRAERAVRISRPSPTTCSTAAAAYLTTNGSYAASDVVGVSVANGTDARHLRYQDRRRSPPPTRWRAATRPARPTTSAITACSASASPAAPRSTITVTDTMSLTEIASAINAVSSHHRRQGHRAEGRPTPTTSWC